MARLNIPMVTLWQPRPTSIISSVLRVVLFRVAIVHTLTVWRAFFISVCARWLASRTCCSSAIVVLRELSSCVHRSLSSSKSCCILVVLWCFQKWQVLTRIQPLWQGLLHYITSHTQPIISSQEVGHLNQLKVCVCESSVNSCGYYLLPPTNQTSFPLRKSGWLPVAQQRKENLALALKELKLLTLNNTFHICNILPSMPPI